MAAATTDPMSKLPSPFKLVHGEREEDENALLFEAVFNLPYDDTPGARNQLVVHVRMEHESAETAYLTLRSRTQRDAVIMEGEIEVRHLANMLYGFATLQMQPRLVLNEP